MQFKEITSYINGILKLLEILLYGKLQIKPHYNTIMIKIIPI